MPITINGSGTILGISVGGLQDGIITQAELAQPFTSDIAKASTSGTAIDFTGIPSWAKRITVMLAGVSTNGTSPLLFQLGTSGGFQTTGYTTANTRIGASAVIAASSTAGWSINSATAASNSSGIITFTLVNGVGLWVGEGTIASSEPAVSWTSGNKDLAGVLDRVRITTVSANTFDAGTINILYE